jgi:hypothetical protein
MAGAAGRMLQLGNSTRVIVEVWHWRGTCFHVGVLICIYIYIYYFIVYISFILSVGEKPSHLHQRTLFIWGSH